MVNGCRLVVCSTVAGRFCCPLTYIAGEPHYLHAISSLWLSIPHPRVSCLERISLRSACRVVRPARTTDRCATMSARGFVG